MNMLDKKATEHEYSLFLQGEPKEYDVKYDIDLCDPINWGAQPPQTTAKSWSIYDVNKSILIASKNAD